MNVKIVIVIIVVIVIILCIGIGGYYYLSSDKKVFAESESVPTPIPVSPTLPTSSTPVTPPASTQSSADMNSLAPSQSTASQSTATNSIPLSSSVASTPSPSISSAPVAPPQPSPQPPQPSPQPPQPSPQPKPVDNNKSAIYTTSSGTKYTKGTNPTCVMTTGNGTFLNNVNGQWVGMPMDQAIDTCAKSSNLGGHGKCLGIMPTGMTAQPWTGCLAVDNREGGMAYLLTN